MPPFLLIISSLLSIHTPPLHPLLPLVSVTVLIAQWRHPRPYTYQTPTVHHPTAIVETRNVSTNPSSLLIPVNPIASTRLSIAHIHPIEGIIAANAMVGIGLMVPRQILYTNCINVTSIQGYILEYGMPNGMYQHQP